MSHKQLFFQSPKSEAMISIVKAKKDDFQLLADIGRTTLLESHKKSAAAEDLNVYVETNFASDVVREELIDAKIFYHLIYYDGQPAGYSKIVLNADHPNIRLRHVTKLDRLYLRKEFYSLKLGFELFNFNIELARKNAQEGMWLFVWQGNQRAINFYLKAGFEITGNYTFGDGAFIALLKIYDTNGLLNLQNIRNYLPIIRNAFVAPQIVGLTENKKPEITIFLLTYLAGKITDENLKRQISDDIRYVIAQTSNK